MSENSVRLTVLGRPECHLCVEMKPIIAKVREAAAANGVEIEYQEINLAENPELERKYGDEIPVVLINGNVHFSLQVTEEQLAYAILYERDRAKKRWWLPRRKNKL